MLFDREPELHKTGFDGWHTSVVHREMSRVGNRCLRLHGNQRSAIFKRPFPLTSAHNNSPLMCVINPSAIVFPSRSLLATRPAISILS